MYPSEDELEEAFYRGEIDFNQLVILQELIRFGIDSTQLYLLDEIPNLSFFAPVAQIDESELSVEQERGFLKEKATRRISAGKITYNYSRRLEDEGDFRYRTSAEFRASPDVKAAFRLHREYSGLERVVYRKVEYRPKKGTLKKLTFGNFTTRLGLGTILGYRGKLVDFSDETDGESLLYPDYGGSNGLNMVFGNKKTVGELAFSQVRDYEHMISTIGGSFGKAYKNFEPMIITAVTSIRNRTTDKSITDFKYGFNLESNYSKGYNRFEISGQAGESNSFGAILTEGKHRFSDAEINYAGWIYGDSYLDLSGGSKAAGMSRTNEIEDIEFSYSDKRSGQEGGLLKTIVELTEDMKLVSSVIYAQRNEDIYNFEILSALERNVSQNVIIRADHITRVKNRIVSTGETEDIFRRTRLELRYISPEFYVRTYLAYQSETEEDDYTSLYSNFKYKSAGFGEFAVWLNIGKYNHNKGRIDYWYGYIENKVELTQNIRTLTKLTHSYRRGASDSHISTVSLGLEAII